MNSSRKTQAELVTDNTEHSYSAELFRMLKKDHCFGDFCDFERRRKDVQLKLPVIRKIDNQLPKALVYRIRRDAKQVIAFLVTQRIFRNGSLLHYQDSCKTEQLIDSSEFPLLDRQQQPKCIYSKYDFVKICDNCYQIYTLISEMFKKQRSNKTTPTSDPDLVVQSPRTPSIDSVPRLSARYTFTSGDEDYSAGSASASRKMSIKLIAQSEIKQEDLYQLGGASKYKQNKRQQAVDCQRMQLGLLQKRNPRLKPIDTSKKHQRMFNLYKVLGVQERNVQRRQTALIIHRHEQEIMRRKQLIRQEKQSPQDLRQLIQRELQQQFQEHPNSVMFEGSESLFYANTKHLRIIKKFELDSPNQGLDPMKLHGVKGMSFARAFDYHSYPRCPQEALAGLSDQIQYYVWDQHTAIPYILMTTTHNNQLSTHQLLIVQIDLFGSMTEWLPFFKSILETRSNTRLLLYNLPGQAYTFFDDQWDDFLYAGVIDGLVCRIIDQIANRRLIIKCLGLGLGGLILQRFLHQGRDFLKIQALMLINSCLNSNKHLNSNMQLFEDIVKGSSQHPYLGYDFYFTLSQSKPQDRDSLTRKMAVNPITNEGRLVLIKSIIQSHQVAFSLDLNTINIRSFGDDFVPDQTDLYQGLQQCRFVDSSSSDDEVLEPSPKYLSLRDQILGNTPQQLTGSASPRASKKYSILKRKLQKTPNGIRKSIYIEGCHAFWEQDPSKLQDYVAKLLDDTWNE